jgi:hypothetical protein
MNTLYKTAGRGSMRTRTYKCSSHWLKIGLLLDFSRPRKSNSANPGLKGFSCWIVIDDTMMKFAVTPEL